MYTQVYVVVIGYQDLVTRYMCTSFIVGALVVLMCNN